MLWTLIAIDRMNIARKLITILENIVNFIPLPTITEYAEAKIPVPKTHHPKAFH
jgi:hypothetical protein